jgi:hypothetical protein
MQTGTGRNGQWKKQDMIVETDGQYPKKICISVWGEKINEDQLKIDFDVESREYSGWWYTDVKAWKIEVEGASPAAVANADADFDPFGTHSSDEEEEGLPF